MENDSNKTLYMQEVLIRDRPFELGTTLTRSRQEEETKKEVDVPKRCC